MDTRATNSTALLSSGLNPLGLGVGARGGASILGIYGGLNLMYYLGSRDGISEHSSALAYGIEAGYGVKELDLVTVRLQVGIGNLRTTLSAPNGGEDATSGATTSASSSSLYLEPGVTVSVSLGTWFVGADLNAFVLTGFRDSGGSRPDAALTCHGQVGVTF